MDKTYYLKGEAYSFKTEAELSAWITNNPDASETNNEVSVDSVEKTDTVDVIEEVVSPSLSSSDFYYKAYNMEKPVKVVEEPAGPFNFNKKTDYSKSTYDFSPDAKITEEKRITQPGYMRDKEVLQDWLNNEYFAKGMAKDITRGNIVAYQAGEADLGELKKHFRNDLG